MVPVIIRHFSRLLEARHLVNASESQVHLHQWKQYVVKQQA